MASAPLQAAGAFVECSLFSLERPRFRVYTAWCRIYRRCSPANSRCLVRPADSTPPPGLSFPCAGHLRSCSFPSLCCEHAGTEGGWGGGAGGIVRVATCTLASTCILVYPKGQFPVWSPQMQSRGHAGTRASHQMFYLKMRWCVCPCVSVYIYSSSPRGVNFLLLLVIVSNLTNEGPR